MTVRAPRGYLAAVRRAKSTLRQSLGSARPRGRCAPRRIFIGFDERQPLSYQVLQYSILKHATRPVAITPLKLSTLPVSREGLTRFTYSRFLVPWLCDYEGVAVFLDSDMLVTADISELFDLADGRSAVSVVKHEQRYEWSSLMLFDNKRCKGLTPEYVASGDPYSFDWTNRVGELTGEWNHLVGYDAPPERTPRIIHFTAGVPVYDLVRPLGFAEEWDKYFRECNAIASYDELMGSSGHAERLGLK